MLWILISQKPMNTKKISTESLMQFACAVGKHKGKREMYDKMNPIVDGYASKLNSIHTQLDDHIKEQDAFLSQAEEDYNVAMKRREENAKAFCENKTADQLKEWLADQYVPYNQWKDAPLETLIKLAMTVYDE